MPYDYTKDRFSRDGSIDSIGMVAVRVTPSDTVDLAAYGRIVVTVAGTLRVLPASNGDPATATANETIPFGELPVGYVLPFLVRRVLATDTTATVVAVT